MTGTQVAVANYRPDWRPADTYLLIRRVRLDAAAGQVSADPAPGPPAGPALPPPRPPTGLTFAHRDAGPHDDAQAEVAPLLEAAPVLEAAPARHPHDRWPTGATR